MTERGLACSFLRNDRAVDSLVFRGAWPLCGLLEDGFYHGSLIFRGIPKGRGLAVGQKDPAVSALDFK